MPETFVGSQNIRAMGEVKTTSVPPPRSARRRFIMWSGGAGTTPREPRTVAAAGGLGPFPTKGEADADLADAVQAIARGTYLRPEKDLTVGRYLDEWLTGTTTLKASTRRG